jgi:hypothetical protein
MMEILTPCLRNSLSSEPANPFCAGAMQGGIKSIQKIRPKIAVSLYHKSMDVIELSQILLNNLNDYSWFIRCYGANGYDTILYGVPN